MECGHQGFMPSDVINFAYNTGFVLGMAKKHNRAILEHNLPMQGLVFHAWLERPAPN